MRVDAICLSLLTALFSGCASAPYGKAVESQLDRVVRYTEITKDGKTVPISMIRSDSGTLRVPVEAEVDVNSTIAIDISSGEVQVLARHAAVQENPASAHGKDLSDAITLLGQMAEAELAAVAAYDRIKDVPFKDLDGTKGFEDFGAAQKRFGVLQAQFNALAMWEDRKMFTAEVIDSAFDSDPDFAKVGALLQSKLKEADEVYQQTVEQAKRNAASMRLQAFLETPNGSPSAIHLEGYDSLNKKDIHVKNPFVLDADDRTAFDSQFNQVADFSRQISRLRTGEISLNTALQASGAQSLQHLGDLIRRFDPLVKEGVPALAARVDKEVEDFLLQAQKLAEKRGGQDIAPLRSEGEKLVAALEKGKSISGFLQLAKNIEKLRLEWATMKPEALPATIAETADTLSEATNLVTGASSATVIDFKNEIDSSLSDLRTRPAALPEDLWQDILALLKKPNTLATAKGLANDLTAAKEFASDVVSSLQFAQIAPMNAKIRTPESFDVPIEQASGTRLELQRTSRILNDRISVTGILNAGDKEISRTEGSFVVREFGWHSVLAPSVVVARSITTTSSFDRQFRFAPAVAWLQKYYPRSTEDGPFDRLARFFQPGLGIHAAFLNQNPQTNTEIGMGGALSFWQDRIVAGVGWDLMNNSKSYLYVGSNLIPILQALGLGKEGAAGKKP